MLPDNAGRGGDPATGKEEPQQTFPTADRRPAAFPSLLATMFAAGPSPFLGRSGQDPVVLQGWTAGGCRCCSREFLSGAAPNTTAHAATAPWSCIESSVGRSRARGIGKNVVNVEPSEEELEEYTHAESRLEALTFLPQGTCNQIQPDADLAAIHHMDEHQEVEATKNNELQGWMFTEEQNSGGTIGDTLPCTCKRKDIPWDHLSGTNFNVDKHQTKRHHFTAPSTPATRGWQ